MIRTAMFFTTAAMVLSTAPAAAQDDDQRWSGFYVGGSVGIPA